MGIPFLSNKLERLRLQVFNGAVTFSIMTLSVMGLFETLRKKRRMSFFLTVALNVIILDVVMMNVIILDVVMLSVAMLCITTLSVIMLRVSLC
jgi:hypothetical protein